MEKLPSVPYCARLIGSNSYRLRLRILPDGSVKLQAEKQVASSITMLGSAVTVSGLTASANSFIWLRVQISGANPTLNQAVPELLAPLSQRVAAHRAGRQHCYCSKRRARLACVAS